MSNVLEHLSPGQIVMVLLGLMLAVSGAIVTIGNAVEKIAKVVKAAKAPNEEQDKEIAELKASVKELRGELKKQEGRLDELREHHDVDMTESRTERHLVMHALMGCLDGLMQLGANNNVPKIVEEMNTYLNDKAHGKQGGISWTGRT